MLTPRWLIPPGSARSGPVLLLPVGADWDCVRTPTALGMPVLHRLLAEPCDANMLGPVLWDREADLLYWPVQQGASNHYPARADLLTAGTWIGAPAWPAAPTARAAWLHLPDLPQLTPPVWLAAALDTNPRPGAAMTQPPAPPERARCEMCTEPPSGSIVRTVGDDTRLVDMGHRYCYSTVLAELHPIRRPARVS